MYSMDHSQYAKYYSTYVQPTQSQSQSQTTTTHSAPVLGAEGWVDPNTGRPTSSYAPQQPQIQAAQGWFEMLKLT